jgi:hypothetical protein
MRRAFKKSLLRPLNVHVLTRNGKETGNDRFYKAFREGRFNINAKCILNNNASY